jgi:hypothetical protein
MIVTQPALICLQAMRERLSRRAPDVGHQAAVAPDPGPAIPAAAIPAAEPLQTRGEGSLASGAAARLSSPVSSAAAALDPNAPLTPDERRARAAALRAMALGRGRRFDAAQAAFIEAARLDPTLDLTRTPAFWQLERAAHEAAIAAYLTVGRDRDAAVLRARVRSTFRPKAVRSQPQPTATV